MPRRKTEEEEELDLHTTPALTADDDWSVIYIRNADWLNDRTSARACAEKVQN